MTVQTTDVLQDQVADAARPLSVSLASERVGSIDRLRVLAAIGIVWFHTDGAPCRWIGYAGLPVFLLIFFSLITIRSAAAPMSGFLRRRCDRLLKPWLFWSALYGLGRLAQAACLNDSGSLVEMLSLETVLMGTHIHLWYLPYAFVWGCVLHAVNRRTTRLGHAAVALSAVGIGLLLLVVHTLCLSSARWMRPLPQWEFGLAAVPLGFAIGRSRMIPSHQQRQGLLFVVVLAVLAGCGVLTVLGRAAPVIPHALAIVLVCLAYGRPVNDSVVVATLAPLTFGVYLIHPLIHRGLACFIAPDQHCAAFIGLTVCLSGLATLALMRTPVRRFV